MIRVRGLNTQGHSTDVLHLGWKFEAPFLNTIDWFETDPKDQLYISRSSHKTKSSRLVSWGLQILNQIDSINQLEDGTRIDVAYW